jgi:hypothetical protein
MGRRSISLAWSSWDAFWIRRLMHGWIAALIPVLCTVTACTRSFHTGTHCRSDGDRMGYLPL